MRAVMPTLLPEVAALRKRTGADRWDEVWDGVLHMPPSPHRLHQSIESGLEFFLRRHWTKKSGGRVYHQINVSPLEENWKFDFRVPDLVLLTPDRFGIDRNEYFCGPPDVVVEIRSPGDETMEKLPFYAALGAPETWVIDRDSLVVEIHVLEGEGYRLLPPADDGWSSSPTIGIQFRPGRPGKLLLQLAADPSTREEIPED